MCVVFKVSKFLAWNEVFSLIGMIMFQFKLKPMSNDEATSKLDPLPLT